MPNCRICDATSGFIKAHIIPEAFFRELRNGDVAPLIVTGVKGKLPKRSPIGVYDPELLCANCELKFLHWDTYGVEKLLTQFDTYFKPVFNKGETIAYEAINIDKLKIVNFLVSVLWRASVTASDFYKGVDLGPHEKIVFSQMLANQGNAPVLFDAVLSRWMDDDDKSLPTTGLLNPHREKWMGVNAYRLYLGKIVAYIRVDQRPFSAPLSDFSLRAAGPCRIISRRFANSKDLNAMRKTVAAGERTRQEFRGRRGAI